MTSVEERLKEVAALGTEIPETGWAYHDGEWRPLADANVSIATHALNYGTGIFEGIRAYWSPSREQLFVFRLRDHFERIGRAIRARDRAPPPQSGPRGRLRATARI